MASELSPLPPPVFIDELAQVLGTSVRTIERARSAGTFPIPELASIDRKPRWSRQVVREFLDNVNMRGRLRRVG